MTVQEYHIFYYMILLTFFVFGGLLQQFKNDKLDNFPFCACLIIAVAILIGNRELNIGTDTKQYFDWFKEYTNIPWAAFKKEYFQFGGDPIFKLIARFFGHYLSFRAFLIAISVTISLLNYLFAREIIKIWSEGSISILFICLMTSFVTWNEETNIMRAGIGTGLFLLFAAYLFRKKYIWAMVIALIAVGTHFSTLIFILLALLAYFVKWSYKVYAVIFVLFLGIAFFGGSILDSGIFKSLGFGRIEIYTKTMVKLMDYDTGFRYNFALFNTGFFLLALWMRKYLQEIGEFLFRFYVFASAIFFLWFTIPFSDRMGAFSWSVIPVIYYVPLVARFKRMDAIPVAAVIVYAIVSFVIAAGHYD